MRRRVFEVRSVFPDGRATAMRSGLSEQEKRAASFAELSSVARAMGRPGVSDFDVDVLLASGSMFVRSADFAEVARVTARVVDDHGH